MLLKTVSRCTVSQNIKTVPEGYEKKYDILNIPTLIFMENGKENNRIVEFPVVNLLDDFSKILKKQPYKNAYADF